MTVLCYTERKEKQLFMLPINGAERRRNMEKKRFYIGVDCEGVACAVGIPGQNLGQEENYAFAALEATREANAAAQALFDMGAEEVIVWDNHHSGINLHYDLLDPRCRILNGSGHHGRFPRIDGSFGGVLFIGYHAREGSQTAVLAHTYSSAAYHRFSINGKPVGEMEIDAAYAGKAGVPVIFAASDDVAVGQARESFPWAETVATKEALSWNSAISLHPQEACRQIYEGVKKACARLEEMQPFTFAEPMEVSICFKRLDAANAAKLYDRERRPFAFADPFTREGTLEKLEDLFN